MKTEKELNAIKEKVEKLSEELKELSEEELQQVAGGDIIAFDFDWKDPRAPASGCSGEF